MLDSPCRDRFAGLSHGQLPRKLRLEFPVACCRRRSFRVNHSSCNFISHGYGGSIPCEVRIIYEFTL